ncbi:MAG: 4-(cytidine 5'-diphospho)-2-C-methyl-D-erythritol kinase [Pseudomonadota bacterium]
MSGSASARARARAKVNLALHVTGQRSDGYHTLSSLVAFVDVGDEVRIQPAREDTLTVDGPFAAHVPPLDGNILGQALSMVRRWGLQPEPVHIHLMKNLPIAAGIGGGSADAAALVELLTNGAALTDAQTADCLALGADIPMCLTGTPALIDGIGSVVSAVDLPRAFCVLVNPLREVSTPKVFAALQSRHNPPLPSYPEPPPNFNDLITWLGGTRNDLMAPASALEPAISDVMDALEGAPFARMSGSGATCFALFESEVDAGEKAADLRAARPDWWIAEGLLG